MNKWERRDRKKKNARKMKMSGKSNRLLARLSGGIK